jgi:hypothetical protein
MELGLHTVEQNSKTNALIPFWLQFCSKITQIRTSGSGLCSNAAFRQANSIKNLYTIPKEALRGGNVSSNAILIDSSTFVTITALVCLVLKMHI